MRGPARGARLAALVVIGAVLASGSLGLGLAVEPSRAGASTSFTGQEPESAPPRAALGPRQWRLPAQDGCDVRGTVEMPAEGAGVPMGPLTISGWAADLNSGSGTGITEVRISLDAEPEQGGVPVAATYGIERPEIAEMLGEERFKASGFALAWDSSSTTAGQHVLYVQVQSACGWTGSARAITVGGAGAATNDSTQALAVTGISGGDGLPTATLIPTRALVDTSGTPSPTSLPTATLIPTRPVIQPISGTPAPPANNQPPAAVPLATVGPGTPQTSPTGSVPAPTNLVVAVNGQTGEVTLGWTAPPNAPTIRSYLVVSNEPDGSQRPIQEVPGSQARVQIRGLNPNIGYSFSVLAIDGLGRRGAVSTSISNSGAPTTTPLPTPTNPPWCTPNTVPGAPPFCPGGFGQGGFGPGGYPPQGYPPQGYPPYNPQYPGAPPYGVPPGQVYGGTFQLTASQTSSTTVQLTWTPLAGATNYNVLQGLNGAVPTQLASVGNTTSYPVTLSIAGSVVFQIQALGPNGTEIGRSSISQPFTTGGAFGGTGQIDANLSQFIAIPASTSMSNPVVTLQAQIRTIGGGVLPNVSVIINQPGNLTVTPLQAVTDGSGNANFQVRAAAAGTYTITGTANGIGLRAATVTFTP